MPTGILVDCPGDVVTLRFASCGNENTGTAH